MDKYYMTIKSMFDRIQSDYNSARIAVAMSTSKKEIKENEQKVSSIWSKRECLNNILYTMNNNLDIPLQDVRTALHISEQLNSPDVWSLRSFLDYAEDWNMHL